MCASATTRSTGTRCTGCPPATTSMNGRSSSSICWNRSPHWAPTTRWPIRPMRPMRRPSSRSSTRRSRPAAAATCWSICTAPTTPCRARRRRQRNCATSLAGADFLMEASRRLGFDVVRVDPNDIPTLPINSHAFWYEDPWVSNDLLGLVLLKAAPTRRGLAPRDSAGGIKYWTLPPDFDTRVKQLFAPALPGAAHARPAPRSAGARLQAQVERRRRRASFAAGRLARSSSAK